MRNEPESASNGLMTSIVVHTSGSLRLLPRSSWNHRHIKLRPAAANCRRLEDRRRRRHSQELAVRRHVALSGHENATCGRANAILEHKLILLAPGRSGGKLDARDA